MLTLNEQNFSQAVQNGNGVTLVDFWAPWCMPCRMIAPILDRVHRDYHSKIKIGKVNVDENPGLSSKYGVMAIPTLVLFKNGKEVKRVAGVLPERNLKALIDEVISTN